MGELVKRNVTGPFVVVRIAGNGNLAVALLSNRHTRAHHVSDIAFDIRVNRVLRWAPNAFHVFAEFFPIARLAKPGVAASEAAGFRGSPTQRIGFVSLAVNNGAVACHGHP